MIAEILSVGTELLLGDTINTNAAFLGRELAKLGISVYTQTVVGDNPKRLMRAYSQAFERGADMVITIGGLGPTEDDITKEVAAEYFDQPLVLHEPSWKYMQDLWAKMRPSLPIAKNNKKQAMLPEGCVVLSNPNGSAPGVYMEKDNKKIVMLPGPPNELVPMFLNMVAPLLREMSDTVLISKTLKVVGIGESAVEEQIKSLINSQDNPTIAPYAKTAEVHLRITASAKNEEEARELIAPVTKELYNILGTAIYGEDDDTLESVVAGLLKEKGFTLSCAESCTGGLVTAKLINHPGVSDVLHEGVVTYANEAKMHRLGVSEEILKEHGAVSAQTAAAMAEGVASSMVDDSTSGSSIVSDSSVGLSTTGIAGPGGGTEDKPVGLVYLGLHVPGKGTQTKKLTLTGDRMKIRERATIAALDFLRLTLR